MSDFQNRRVSDRSAASREADSKSGDFQTDMALELNIGAAARVARRSHEDIHVAMVSGTLPHQRDRDGRRVVKLGDLLAWMRTQQIPALAV